MLPQMQHLLVSMAVVATGAPASTARVFTPEDFGGDPTGGRDSTFAVQTCIDAALAFSASNSTVSTGVQRHEVDGTDHGGVVIDLNGGAFAVNRTIAVGAAPGGNWHMCCGSLLAVPGFHGDWVLAVSSTKSLPNGNQDISVRDLAIDAGNQTGGLSLDGTLRGEVSGCYIIHFTSVGLQINHGHEVLVHDSWFGQYNNDDPGQVPTNATAILVQGNDHSVHDCVVFGATGVGISNWGAANSFEGNHIYGVDVSGGSGWVPAGTPGPAFRPSNFSRVGMVMTLYSHFSRVVNNYWDGVDVVIELSGTQSGGHKLCCAVTIDSNVFLGGARVWVRPTAPAVNGTGLQITGNSFDGLDGADGCTDQTSCASVIIDTGSGTLSSLHGSKVANNACAGGRHCVSTTASARNTQTNASRISVSFENLLLPGLPIVSKQYSVELVDDVESVGIPRHTLVANPTLPLNVTVVLDRPVDATVYVFVSQEQPDSPLTIPHRAQIAHESLSTQDNTATAPTSAWRDSIRTHALLNWKGRYGAPAGLRLQGLEPRR
jgi:hypothetical protein